MITYKMINKSMNCPICGKPLIESEYYDEVACSNSKCKFNNIINLEVKLNIFDKLETVENHFKNISIEEFEKNLEDLGINNYD